MLFYLVALGKEDKKNYRHPITMKNVSLRLNCLPIQKSAFDVLPLSSLYHQSMVCLPLFLLQKT